MVGKAGHHCTAIVSVQRCEFALESSVVFQAVILSSRPVLLSHGE